MPKENELNRCFRMLQDHEKRIAALEGRTLAKATTKIKAWYKSGSTTEKVVSLVEDRFFSDSRSMSEIITELKSRDYHLKPSDLTMSLRAIVRKGILKRTKRKVDGSPSKNWLYAKI